MKKVNRNFNGRTDARTDIQNLDRYVSPRTFVQATQKNIEAEKKLEEEILKLEKESLDTEEKQKILEELDSKRNQLEEFRKDKIKGILLRSALNWAEFGEKPSKFFLNPKKAGSFDPISQPGGGVDSTPPPRISAAERRKIM